jgi:hypothetical protein
MTSVFRKSGGGSLYVTSSVAAFWNEQISKLDEPDFALVKKEFIQTDRSEIKIFRKGNSEEVKLTHNYHISKLVGLKSHFVGSKFEMFDNFKPSRSIFFDMALARLYLDPYAVDHYLFEVLHVTLDYDIKSKHIIASYPDRLRENQDLLGYARFLVSFIRKNHSVLISALGKTRSSSFSVMTEPDTPTVPIYHYTGPTEPEILNTGFSRTISGNITPRHPNRLISSRIAGKDTSNAGNIAQVPGDLLPFIGSQRQ